MSNYNNSEPSYVHKDSDRVIVFIAVLTGVGMFMYLFKGIYEKGFENIFASASLFEIGLVWSVLIGFFLMIFSGASSLFPIYINSNGGYYRTIFLRKKNLRWEDVDVISILKGKDYGKVKYNAVVCGRDSIDLVWGVSTFEGDDYHDIYKVIDYYVQKYNIKVTLENTLDGGVYKLSGMPEKLDFSK